MRNTTPYQFIGTDTEALLAELSERYTEITGRTLQPADPDVLFLRWIASVIVAERVSINFAANQNLPSRAVGENLDAIGQFLYGVERGTPGYARTTERVTFSAPQTFVIYIKKGTRFTSSVSSFVWETPNDISVAAGSAYIDIPLICRTAGTAPNAVRTGEINRLIDVDNILYYASCTNLTDADGGYDAPTDDEYYEILRKAVEAYSTAGPRGAYEYHAMHVSNEIADVRAVNPRGRTGRTVLLYEPLSGQTGVTGVAFVGVDNRFDANDVTVKYGGETLVEDTGYTVHHDTSSGLLTIRLLTARTEDEIEVWMTSRAEPCQVNLYALMKDGTPAGDEIKNAIFDACNDETVRPLTDFVYVDDPDAVTYGIDITYYTRSDAGRSAADIQEDVDKAVADYAEWQHGVFGRDINPTHLIGMVMAVDGVSRVEVTSPEYAPVSGSGIVPQYAKLVGTPVCTPGGVDDD